MIHIGAILLVGLVVGVAFKVALNTSKEKRPPKNRQQ